LYCPNCGEPYGERAKFCSNCGLSLSGLPKSPPVRAAGRPVAPFVVSLFAVAGLLAVAFFMSFVYDAPGQVGSSIAQLFHAVGAIQLALGLGVLISAIFLVMRGFSGKLLGGAMLGLGAVSILALLVIVAEGTFAVIFLAVPGLLAVVAGLMARRSAA
jgi:hypothetical protein